MSGSAFSVEDALMVVRWAGLIRPDGYRVAITPLYRDADEVIEIYIPNATKPTFKVHRAAGSVRVTDRIGLTLSFPTLADALMVIAPLAKPDRREMVRDTRPAWLPVFPAQPAREAGSWWYRTGRSVRRFAATWSGRHPPGRAEPAGVRPGSDHGCANRSDHEATHLRVGRPAAPPMPAPRRSRAPRPWVRHQAG
ncbi:MAG: hypothetical protein JO157_04420 [Acetobacteraceae bacterium]|nr:hypothetical protein [Acetobacteraceae bacterium]